MTRLNRKPQIYSFNKAAATKKRAVDAYLLRIFQQKAYQDIKALVQLKIWELEGEDTTKMIDYARQLKAGKQDDPALSLIAAPSQTQDDAYEMTRLQRAKAIAQDTSMVIDEFAHKWLKDGGNEGELITQVMAKEMGGQDIQIDWAARILPELTSYAACNLQTIVPTIEARIGQSLPTLIAQNKAPQHTRGVLAFKRKG